MLLFSAGGVPRRRRGFAGPASSGWCYSWGKTESCDLLSPAR